MVIQVDTREHKSEWERIQNQFDSLECSIFALNCIAVIINHWTMQNSVLTVKKIYKSYAEMSASSMKDSKQSLSERVKQVFS